MWQVAGGHGYIDHDLAVTDMMRYHDAGLRSWDLLIFTAQQKISSGCSDEDCLH